MRKILGFLHAAAISAIPLVLPVSLHAGVDQTYIKATDLPTWGRIFSLFYNESRFDRSYALVLGVGNYEHWKQLEAPSRDAIRIRDFLINDAGFDYVVTLTDEEATLPRVRSLMVDTFPNLVGENDRFFFYFSGHGTQRDIAGRTIGYLPLKISGKQSYASMINMDEVANWASLLAHARQTLFMLDSCFSGLAGFQAKSDDLTEKKLDRLAQYGHHLITAGTANEQSVASLSRWGGSLFTDAFLKGVSGRADAETPDFEADGVVSLKELMKYIEDQIDYESQKMESRSPLSASIKMTPQISNLQRNVGEFFFVSTDRKAHMSRDEGETEAPDETPQFKGADPGGSSPNGIMQPDALVFEQIKGSDQVYDFEVFLEQFPRSVFAPYARARIRALEQHDAPDRAAALGEPPREDEIAPDKLMEFDRRQRREVQAALDVLGYEPGPIDGVLGPNSRRAIRSWQRDARMDPTGYLTESSLSQLVGEAREARLVSSAKITIPANIANTRVYIDEQSLGPVPVNFSLPPGLHKVHLTAEGYQSRDYSIRLSRGENRVLNYKLAPETRDVSQKPQEQEKEKPEENDQDQEPGLKPSIGNSSVDSEIIENTCRQVAFMKSGDLMYRCEKSDGEIVYITR